MESSSGIGSAVWFPLWAISRVKRLQDLAFLSPVPLVAEDRQGRRAMEAKAQSEEPKVHIWSGLVSESFGIGM